MATKDGQGVGVVVGYPGVGASGDVLCLGVVVEEGDVPGDSQRALVRLDVIDDVRRGVEQIVFSGDGAILRPQGEQSEG